MSSMTTVTTFIRQIGFKRLNSLRLPEPDQVTIPAAPLYDLVGDGHFGNRLHAAFDDFIQGRPADPDFSGAIEPICEWLSDMGVQNVRTEWSCYRRAGLPPGTLDALLEGGPKPVGILELKSEHEGRQNWFTEDALQVALYGLLLRSWNLTRRPPWAAIAYVTPGEPEIRIYCWRDTRGLLQEAERLYFGGRN